MNRFCLLLCAATAIAGSSAHAQNNNDGSLYSRFGLGQLESFSTSQSTAMGTSGYGSHSFNYVNFGNPGSWSDQVLTRVAAGFTYQNITIADAGENESRLSSGFLNSVQFGIPVMERRLGVAVGFAPFSRVSYSVQEPGVLITSSPVADTVDFLVNFEGSGGLQQIVGGLGYRPHKNFSIGISLHGFFGIVENGRRTSFIEPASGSQYVETNVSVSTQLTGFTATLGTLFNAGTLLRDGDLLTVGAAFTLPTTLSAERVRSLGEELDRDTLGTVVDGDVEIPWRLAGGLTYQPDSRWTISAGGRLEPWTDFKSDLGFPGIEPGSTDRLSDYVQVGAGVEFLPAGSDLLAPYLSRIGYRLGFYHDRSYVSPLPDASIKTSALAAGLSLPTLLSGTRLDINVEVGKRGSTEGGLVEEMFYRLSAIVNIGER
ncbi:MAG: hypothetical protein WD275_03525, partial [Rhodothermales bacterium]